MASLDATSCPYCAGRDVVELENGELFCPWCLWSASRKLILEPGRDQETDFLGEFTVAFEKD